jgi:hypothetical protein
MVVPVRGYIVVLVPVVAYGTVPGQQYDTPTVGPIVGTTGYMLCDTDLS